MNSPTIALTLLFVLYLVMAGAAIYLAGRNTPNSPAEPPPFDLTQPDETLVLRQLDAEIERRVKERSISIYADGYAQGVSDSHVGGRA